MGTCEQRNTGQAHPDKGTGHRSYDYLQNHTHFGWNSPRATRKFQKESYMCDSEKMAKINHKAQVQYIINNLIFKVIIL